MLDFERSLRFLNLEPLGSEQYGRTRLWRAEAILGIDGQTVCVLEVGAGASEANILSAMQASNLSPSLAIFKQEHDLKQHR